MTRVEIEYQGDVTKLNTKPLNAMILAALFRASINGVNMVNAPQIAKSRGIAVSETRTEDCADFHTAMILTITTADGPRSIKGTLFAGEPRIIDIEGVPVEAGLSGHTLFVRNDDTPGIIGQIGTMLGDAKVNIADFRLGRIPGQATAVALVSIDSAVPDDVFAKISGLKQVRQAKRLKF